MGWDDEIRGNGTIKKSSYVISLRQQWSFAVPNANDNCGLPLRFFPAPPPFPPPPPTDLPLLQASQQVDLHAHRGVLLGQLTRTLIALKKALRAGRQAGGRAGRQTGRQAGGQAGRQAGRQAHVLVETCLNVQVPQVTRCGSGVKGAQSRHQCCPWRAAGTPLIRYTRWRMRSASVLCLAPPSLSHSNTYFYLTPP